MAKNKSSISKAGSYGEMGEFWDTHDATDFLEKGKDVEMDINIESETTYYALENGLSERLQKAAKKHGVSSDTLMNMWLLEKLEAEKGY